MRVALFGGSFDPPHRAHREIARVLSERFDEVWVLPASAHPGKRFAEPFEKRLELCRLNFSGLWEKVKVLEVSLSPYAIDAVEILQRKFPELHFTWVGGADTEREFRSWHRAEELGRLLDFLWLPRERGGPFPWISSTELRQWLISEPKRAQAALKPEVWNSIATQKLYGVKP